MFISVKKSIIMMIYNNVYSIYNVRDNVTGACIHTAYYLYL